MKSKYVSKIYKSLFFSILLSTPSMAEGAKINNDFITISPTWNLHFGETTFNSFGLQVHYWRFDEGLPWGYGGGVEYSFKSGPIMFADLQAGAILGGTSHGLVYNPELGFGYQGAIWANYFLGINLQYRYLGANYFAPGMYLALPMPVH